MFSAADREFNAACAAKLRHVGYHVFLPQDSTINAPTDKSSPTSEGIFRADTAAILDSDLMVACIDQENIDSGVACEVGIAHSHGIPVIGLYTDIRQHREGVGRMYKNLYVVGAIESVGEIATSVDALIGSIKQHYSDANRSTTSYPAETVVKHHFESISDRISQFIRKLENWYYPAWSAGRFLERWFEGFPPGRIVEVGCGTGEIGKHIAGKYPGAFYLGYDISEEMIRLASSSNELNSLYTSDWTEVTKQAKHREFDTAILSFTLHDHADPKHTLSLVTDCVRPNGTILIVDLSTWDLPLLTNLLRRNLGLPASGFDSRLDPVKLVGFAEAAHASIEQLEVAMPVVRFPTSNDIVEYLEMFGVFDGMDLPLGLRGTDRSIQRETIERVLGSQIYPYTDQRAFVICTLKKQVRSTKEN